MRNFNQYFEEFVVYDIETTGLSPESDDITQIAAMHCRTNKDGTISIVNTFERYIKIERPIPEKIIELTGITNELLSEKGVPIETALLDFNDFVGSLTLIAHNGKKFDSRFLENAAAETGLFYMHEEFDSLLLAKLMYPGKKQKRTQLALIELFKIDLPENIKAHNALSDCYMLAKIVECMLLELKSKSVEEIQRYLDECVYWSEN